MEITFEKANDQHIVARVFYVASSKIYNDTEHTVLASTADLKHAFDTGVLALDNGSAVARAIAFSVASNVATVVTAFDATSGVVAVTNAA